MNDARQRGAALVVAMLVAAIAAAVATTLTVEGARWQSIVEGRRDHARAASLASAGIQWARQALADDAARGPVDHLGEPWAIPLPPTPVDGGQVEGRIEDAQARLNVNAIAGDDAAAAILRERLAVLFARRGVDPALVDAIADFVDPDTTPRERGAEDSAYVREGAVAANAPLTRAGELAAVRGVTPSILARIAGDVVALPAQAALDVNTASADVLASTFPTLDGDAIAAIVASRLERPYASIAEFRSRAARSGFAPDTSGLAVGSDHFLVTVRARHGHAVVRAEALIVRGDGRLPAVAWQVLD
ncbi:Type II secretion system protein K [Burkholderiales bacterium]|nr:Type II secretion system protein K [Burkholderiales bacterium]